MALGLTLRLIKADFALTNSLVTSISRVGTKEAREAIIVACRQVASDCPDWRERALDLAIKDADNVN